MTLVTIDLGDVAGGHDPDDYVIIRAEAFRESPGGGITSTAEVKIPLVDGVGQAEVEPGPVVVSFRCRAVADTREKRGVVPASGTVGIEKVLENSFEYLPPVVNDALETIKDAVAAEVDAIKWDRGHVPLDATSISDLDVGSWNVSNDTRAEIVGTPGLRLGNLSIGSIGTSKTATFISQGTASEKPGMWVQAERLGVWSGWQQVLPAVVPPSDLWYRGYVDTPHVTLNDLANGVWGVSGRDHAVRFGLPADFGSLQLMQIGSSRSAFFIGQETGLWIATSQGQVWGEWKRPGNAGGATTGSGAGLKTVPVAVSTGAGGTGELSGRYRVLTQVTAPVSRFRVHVSTAHPMWEGDRGPSTLGAVYIGHRSGDAGIANQFALKTGNSTVAAAGEWVSRWITHDLSRETLIDFQVTATNAYNLIAPAWKQDGASWVQQATIPLWAWLEVETSAETPTVALVGDSTGAGSGSHMPVWDSALHIHARREGFIPVLYASSGDLLEGNTDPEDRNYKRWAGFGPYDSVIIQAGSNDIHNGTALAAMQEHYLAVTEAVAQLSPVVIGGTVKPRYPAHPEYDGTRVAYNQWLKTQPGTTRDVLDFSHAVAPGGAIDPVDNADGAHLTSSGHQKMATAFDGVTVARIDGSASTDYVDAAADALDRRLIEVEPVLATPAEYTTWAHVTTSGERLPLGYSPDGRLDPTARQIWAEDVNREYMVPGDEYVHALITERGELLIGFRADGSVSAPGLKVESAPSGPSEDFYIHSDKTVQPVHADMSQLTVWGSSTPNLLIPSITAALADLPLTVNDQAQGGERIEHAAARMGVIPALIDPVTIPASGTVDITSQNFPIYGAMLDFTGTLGGVHGTLGATADSLQFTRTTDGEPVTLTEPTPVIPDVGPTIRDHVSIIGAGKNNIMDAGSEPLVIDYNDQMFDYLTPQNPRALILGMHNNRGSTPTQRAWVATVNNHLRRRFGPLFIDLLAVVTSPDIWDQTGITPTPADLDNQALGDLPASLGMDSAHFNNATNTVVAGIIRDRMTSLGWY